MATLRDFIYLDTVRLHSFVSQVQGGLINEVSEATKQLGGKVDASKGKESERRQVMQPTDPAYFDILHRYLQQNELIDITNSSARTREGLATGQFVEVQGVAEPPVVESWVSQFEAMFDFVERNFKLFRNPPRQAKKSSASTLSNQQLREFKSIRDFLLDYIGISRQDPGRQYIRLSSKQQQYRVWVGLIPSYVIVPLQSILPGEVRVLGRVERLLSEGEIWKIVDIAQFNQAAQAEQMIEMLNGSNTLIGRRPIGQADLQAQYPDTFITPVAIYK
ncbi:MAG: DUF6414 family protein [Nitrososphaera sp.]